MALTDSEIRSFRAMAKPYKRADGGGLYLEIFPNGAKLWRFKFRFAAKEKRLAFGAYPDVTLASARRMREAARTTLAEGLDPAEQKKRDKRQAKLEADNSFGKIADEFIESKMTGDRRADRTLVRARWFLALLRPALGNRPITAIEPAELLEPLRKLERKGNLESARRCRAFASRVFRYAVATGRAKSDPAALLRGALSAPQVKHHAAILDRAKFGELLRAIDGFEGSPITRLALQIAPHVFVRPGELRHAEWSEIDRAAARWDIPASKMKGRRPHSVPLTRQVLALLDDLEELTGGGKYLFPSMQTLHRPMSENTINAAFRRMGFSKDEVTGHGLRTTASSFLNESGKWSADAVERALAHRDSDVVRGIYNRGSYWEERVAMNQWWSDRIDGMRDGATIHRMLAAPA